MVALALGSSPSCLAIFGLPLPNRVSAYSNVLEHTYSKSYSSTVQTLLQHIYVL
jgi:hypothetical protein